MSAQSVLLFPGQGLQFVGMGQTLAAQSPAAAEVFAQADAALGFSLSQLCWQGPQDELTLTANAQPAILTHSIAALRALQTQSSLQVGAAVGHSLGEFTALVAAGALEFADAVALVHARGRFMQEANANGEGAMAAVLGLDFAVIEGCCVQAAGQEVVVCATRNDAMNTVISGHAAAVARASELCTERGALKVVPLPVSAAFHSPLMQPAAEKLRELLQNTRFARPHFPIRSTIVDRYLTDPTEFPQLLTLQMTAPVLWQSAIAALSAGGFATALALGPASSLPGMVKRTARGMKCRVVSEAADLFTLTQD